MKKLIAFILVAVTLGSCFVFNTGAAETTLTDEETIWFYFKDMGMTDEGVAGLMGNLFAESGLKSNNLQNSFESRLGYTDQGYTDAVDNGTYTLEQFMNDGAGYGLAQWTFYTRKRSLYRYAEELGTSIGDLNMQLEFLYLELTMSYGSTVLSVLETTTDLSVASNTVLHKFEQPADQSASVEQRRLSYSQTYYNKFAGAVCPDSSEDSGTDIKYGDVDGDGLVNPFDASLVLRYDAMLITELNCMEAADVNDDKLINPYDASLILRFDALLITEFPR